MNETNPYLSIVIPLYNEEGNTEELRKETEKNCLKKHFLV